MPDINEIVERLERLASTNTPGAWSHHAAGNALFDALQVVDDLALAERRLSPRRVELNALAAEIEYAINRCWIEAGMGLGPDAIRRAQLRSVAASLLGIAPSWAA
jgi:hypothetical protein